MGPLLENMASTLVYMPVFFLTSGLGAPLPEVRIEAMSIDELLVARAFPSLDWTGFRKGKVIDGSGSSLKRYIFNVSKSIAMALRDTRQKHSIEKSNLKQMHISAKL